MYITVVWVSLRMVSMSDKVQVAGRSIKLDETRSVFIGRAEGLEEVFVTYTNGDQELKFRMSLEAADATQYLLNLVLDEIVGENKVA